MLMNTALMYRSAAADAPAHEPEEPDGEKGGREDDRDDEADEVQPRLVLEDAGFFALARRFLSGLGPGAVLEPAQARDLDGDGVAVLEKEGRPAEGADAVRRAAGDQVARLEPEGIR